jgi:hypothetical protein
MPGAAVRSTQDRAGQGLASRAFMLWEMKGKIIAACACFQSVSGSYGFAFKNPSPVVHPIMTIQEVVTFSPFGLGCRQCIRSASIQSGERSIQIHLKKHGMDSRLSTVRSLLEEYKKELLNAKALGSIESFRSNYKTYYGYSVFVVGLFSR